MTRRLSPQRALGVAAALALAGSPTASDRAVASSRSDLASPSGGASARDELVEHAEDVADYTLRASLDPDAHLVHGEGIIRWKNASRRAVQELWLHLYLNAFKNDASVFMRERVGGRGSIPPLDWGRIDLRRLALREDSGSTDLLSAVELHRPGDDDETDARVPLPRQIAPGEHIELDLAFDDKLPSIVERTGYKGRFHMVGQWFPKLARLEADGTWAHFPFHHLSEFYADYGTYDVTLDVPAGYTLGATGPVVEQRREGGRTIERHRQSDVHDFAWTAWDRWETRRETIDGVAVTLLYPPGFAAIAERELAALRFALPYESARYGRYPYPVLTVVHPQDDAREAGGMEYPTLITSGGVWWMPPGIEAPEIVTVHELGHQWFYGLVATNEAAWPVLDEGINQYAEVDTMGKWRGEGSAAAVLGFRLSDASIQSVASNRAVHDEPVAQPASVFTSGANYSRLVYSRTAAVLVTLARVYGEDAVADALGRYAREQRFAHPGPEDLLSAFRAAMGPRAADTLRVALFDRGWVDYAIDGIEADRKGANYAGYVLVRRRGTLSFPVDVELLFLDGSTQRMTWDGEGDAKRLAWQAASPLRGAVVDPDDRVFVDQNLENNHGTAPDRSGAGAPRTLERAEYWMQLAVQTMAP